MRKAPLKWTRHHVHRLYHLSMLMVFFVITIVVIVGIFWSLEQASALTLTEQSDSGVSATVQGIESGPTVITSTATPVGVGAGPLAYIPKQNPTPTPFSSLIQPNVTINPVKNSGTQNVVISGKQAQVPSFDNPYPSFSGMTNIKSAIIFLQINSYQTIRGTTYVDQNGNWAWQSSEIISPGQHRVTVTAQDPTESAMQSFASLDFFINASSNWTAPTAPLIVPGNGGNLFDVLVKIPQQFKTVTPGDDLAATVKLINFGSSGHPVDVAVQYTITDASGTTVLQASETLAVATQISLLKTFHTSQELKTGTYTLTVRVPSQDVIATSADTFELNGAPIIALGNYGKIDFTLIFQAFLAMLFVFSLVVYFEYNKVSMLSSLIKKIDEQDIRVYNH